MEHQRFLPPEDQREEQRHVVQISSLKMDRSVIYIFDYEKDGDEITKKEIKDAQNPSVENGLMWNPNCKPPDIIMLRLFAQQAYKNYTKANRDMENVTPWKLLYRAKTTFLYIFGRFYGELYFHSECNYFMLVIKGTSNFGNWWSNFTNVICNCNGGEVDSAFTFGEKVRTLINSFHKKPMLFITGHSLGGFLAQIITYTIMNCRHENNIIVLNEEPVDFGVFTVVFDSPAVLNKIRSIDPRNPIAPESLKLPITNFIYKSNIVNNCNFLGLHLGRIAAVHFGGTEEEGFLVRLRNVFYYHSIANIIIETETELKTVCCLDQNVATVFNRTAVPLSFFTSIDILRLNFYKNLPEQCKVLIGKLPRFSATLSEIQIEDDNVFAQEFIPKAIQVLRNSREILDCKELESATRNFFKGKPKSYGKNQIYIDQAIYKNGVEQYSKNAVKFAVQLKAGTQKFVLISSNAGMGKSTALKQIAETLQSELPHKLIVHMNLNLVQSELEASKNVLKSKAAAVEFVQNTYLAEFRDLLREHFKQKVEKKDMVFLFDSLDEVCPNHRDTTETLIEFLRETDIQIVVTTRPHEGHNFKNAEIFNLETLHTDELRVQFINKKFESLEKEKPSDTRTWLKNISAGINEDFWKVPLFLEMAVSIYGNEVEIDKGSVINRKTNIYKAFVEISIAETIKTKFGFDKSVAAQTDDFTRIETEYNSLLENYAICSIFFSGQVSCVKNLLENYDVCKKKVQRSNLAKLYNNGELVSFVHKSYAEYLVAKAYLRQLQKGEGKPLLTSQIKQILIDDDFDEIRTHFSGILAYSERTPETEDFFSTIRKLLKRKKN